VAGFFSLVRGRKGLHPFPSIATSAMKMETVSFSETLASTYASTRRQNPEEQHSLVPFVFISDKGSLQLQFSLTDTLTPKVKDARLQRAPLLVILSDGAKCLNGKRIKLNYLLTVIASFLYLN
jgi:hypothetical protein